MNNFIRTDNKIYGNIPVYSKDGIHMFMCNNDKANWYLKKGLAEENVLGGITLNFEPNGLGHAGQGNYFLSAKQNVCVVCGNTKNLTAHHIIPYIYWRQMPDFYTKMASHDIVPLCRKCHDETENFYFLLKKKISEIYKVNIEGNFCEDYIILVKVRKAWHKIKYKRSRRTGLIKTVEKYFNKKIDEISDEEVSKLKQKIKDGRVCHGKLVLDILEGDYFWFVKMWREYFVRKMNPQFLSDNWSVNTYIKD